MRKIYTKTFVYFAEIQYIYNEINNRNMGHVFSAIKKADIPSLSPEEATRLRNAFHFILAAFGIILPEG